MKTERPLPEEYFILNFPLADEAWRRFGVEDCLPTPLPDELPDPSYEIRKLADRIGQDPVASSAPLPGETLLALRTVNQALRHVTRSYFRDSNPGGLERCRQWAVQNLGSEGLEQLDRTFLELFPPQAVRAGLVDPDGFRKYHAEPESGRDQLTLEMLLLFLNVTNPAARSARFLFDDEILRQRASFVPFVTGLEAYLNDFEPPGTTGTPLFQLLRAPMLASPDSLSGQIAYMRDHWGHLLPDDLMRRLLFALDMLKEIDLRRSGEPGPPPVLEFGPGSPGWGQERPEPEAFSRDADWMSNVVLMAKSVYVWLDQISRSVGHPVHRLDQIPDHELDRLAGWGVTGLWLIGLWERSEASRLIKQYMGNPEAAASAYALHDYHIAHELGGDEALANLRQRAWDRGIRLASDMVPNHMGIDSTWVMDHPEYFMQAGHPPYPAYKFTGGNLSDREGIAIRIEDGYWNHSDAAVVFQRLDERTGETRYIYHGNDGTSMPWNDTAQLNFLLPEVREAVTQVILEVARRFPIIRFDAAMTLAKKHYQRLWFPAPGDAGAIPSRAEHGMSREEFDKVFPEEFWRQVVDRVAAEVPDTLLLAEAFWLMEGYFVRTLGMHRVYNSAFMNMLKLEDNAKYRQTIKNVLEFSPGILMRFVNFMNNPDERTAVEQFGKGDKYFGCVLLLVTMPGLPMLGHGQIEGFSEKYGMEYRKAYWEESVDEDLVRRHEREIFPLMRRRHIFSGAENFALFDFESSEGWVNENVFVFANRAGDERGLVIVNNSYDATSGSVRTSTPINRGSADNPDLVRRSLTEALALSTEDGVWHIFRDHIQGLDYIRSASELAGSGFYCELQGYGYRALIDFRTVRDPDGSYADLARDLGGRGVPDLARALRRRQIEPALKVIRNWISADVMAALESAPVTAAGPKKKAKKKKEAAPSELPNALSRFQEQLQGVPGFKIPEKLGRRSRQDLESLLAGLPGSRILQALYLGQVLDLLGSQEFLSEDSHDDNLRSFRPEDLSLVLEDMATVLEDWTGHPYSGGRTVQLAAALHSAQGCREAFGRGKTSWFVSACDHREFLDALGVNTHEGRRWLSKEDLEILLEALVIAGLAGKDPANPLPMLDARAIILNAAEDAGYDLDRMLARLR